MSENIYNPEFVKRLFDRMSASYERMNFITSFGFSIRWRRQFLDHLPSTKDNVEIIDLLAGMGETWTGVRNKFPNATLSALDFSEEMLKKANRKNISHFNNEVRLLHQNVLQNELPGEHYDIVICAFGLKTFNEEQLRSLAKEVSRILKPGGQFSFVEVSEPANRTLYFLYKFYLKRIIPVLGKLLIGNPAEYRMLWRYTEMFKNAKEIIKIFDSGELEASFVSYFYGCATGFAGCKKSS